MAGRGVQTARLNKRTGCESPRCRHCKCRDGLPLVKASHWSNPRRQTGRRSRHKSGDLRKPLEPLNKSSSAASGSFSPSVQFQKREILRSRCQRKLAYGCGIPLAGTYSIPPLLEPSSGEKSLAHSSCRFNQSFHIAAALPRRLGGSGGLRRRKTAAAVYCFGLPRPFPFIMKCRKGASCRRQAEMRFMTRPSAE